MIHRLAWLVAAAGLVLVLAACAAPAPTATPTSAPPAAAPTSAGGGEEVPAPNCSGGNCDQPGPAITQNLKGDASAGAQVFADNCKRCHGDQGKGGVDNPGSTDGTVPPLNPIDPAFPVKDRAAFAKAVDLFIEHGSTPEGNSPTLTMLPFGDQKKLTPQQIADVIAYVLSLNPAQ